MESISTKESEEPVTPVPEKADPETPAKSKAKPFWVYFVPIIFILIGVAIIDWQDWVSWIEIHWIYYLITIVFIPIWYKIGSKMTTMNSKAAIVVNIEDGTIWPIVVGRNMWKNMKKIGKPLQAWSTPDGESVELIRRFDEDKMEIEYPFSAEFSDLKLAAISGQYNKLIMELKKQYETNHELKDQQDLQVVKNSIRKGQKYAKQLNEIFEDIIDPSDEGTE